MFEFDTPVILLLFSGDCPTCIEIFWVKQMKKRRLGQTYPLSLSTESYLFLFRSSESSKRLFVFISIAPSGLQLEHPLSGRMSQPACAVATAGRLSRYQKEPVPDGGNHGLGLVLIQNLFLEKIHEIVSQHQQLKPRAITRITVGNHLVQTKTVNTFLDEVLTAGPLIVKTPNPLGTFPAVCYDHLVVVFNFPCIEKFQLFPGTSIGSYLLTNYHPAWRSDRHPQRGTAVDNITTLTYSNTPSDTMPSPHMSYLALYPRLHGHHNGKFNALLDQVLDQLGIEKSTVCSQPDLLDMGGKFFDQTFDKLNTLIAAMALATTKDSSNVIPGLSYKTQQGVVTLSSLLPCPPWAVRRVGIVSHGGSLLIAIDRNHMRVQIKGDLPITPVCPPGRLVLLPQLHDKIKVQGADLFRYRNLHRAEKSANCRLNRKTTESHYLLKYLVSAQYLHMIGPAIPQEHPVQTSHKQSAETVLACPAAFYLDLLIQHLFNPVALEKSLNQPSATKTRQVAPRELLSYRDGFLAFTFCILLRYSLFHLLSASFVVLLVFRMPFYYYIWRHFCLENYTTNA